MFVCVCVCVCVCKARTSVGLGSSDVTVLASRICKLILCNNIS